MKKLKGTIEIEFVQIGKQKIENIQSTEDFKKAFDMNWKNITKMTEKILTDFYKKYKIKIKLKEKSEYVE